MRRGSNGRRWFGIVPAGAIWLVCGLTACVAPGDGPDDAAMGDGDPDTTQDQAELDRVAAEAERLSRAMARAQPRLTTAPEVQWLTGAESPGAPAPAEEADPVHDRAVAVPEVPTPLRDAEPRAIGAGGGASAAEPGPPPEASLRKGRDELLAALHQAIAGSGDAALSRSLDAAALTAVSGGPLEESVLAGLSPAQRQQVRRFHEVVTLLRQQLEQGGGSLDLASVQDRIGEVFGHQPLEIRRVELCRRVTGYGVYEPFERTVFLAGRPQRAILYVELDHFRSHPTDGEQYEVLLTQEVVLYNATDGLAVWRQEPVRVEDVSRNRRRDFFVVQMLTLPARLTVGKYRLKVRLTDLHGGSIDERTVPIEIVADEALVSAGKEGGG